MTNPGRVPKLWGGLECTFVRIGEHYRDQTRETGHHRRLEDLERVAALGIRTLRYPVLWETVAPDSPEQRDWRWHDERLALLQNLGIAPIAGLVHHGSGPRYTDLLDPDFPKKLAVQARATAQRYPWIEAFTPVNEPLTTARFSGLYGHWYPHAKNDHSFLKALMIQCKAVLLSMRAIRSVTPQARLVQTEDIGKIFSTTGLSYQADFENERRWLSYDLLCGRIDPRHEWWRIFLENGIAESDLALFFEGDGTPDMLGVNHYLTSERYLDDRHDCYPPELWGSNGRHDYADVEAVRIDLPKNDLGPLARLREVWERYRLPIAVTEVHHGCTRDEQLRWLHDVWNAAIALKREGGDCRAVTIWSLFGAIDWNTLLTQRNGFYEPGAFDIRSRKPRPTALAKAASALVTAGHFDHPVLDIPGWWKRDARFYRMPEPVSSRPTARRPLLIAGATGTLGQAFSRICHERGLDHVLLTRHEMDIAEPASVSAAIERHRPWAVINAAGYVRVPQAEKEPDLCLRENRNGAETLALACAKSGAALLTFSSDLVFDGSKGSAYVESDPISPLGVYGQSKAQAEAMVLARNPQALIIRASAFFGPWDRHNFLWHMLNTLAAGHVFEAGRQVVSPTYVPDLVHRSLDLLIDAETGIWHLANQGAVSWLDFARMAARIANLPSSLIRSSNQEAVNTSLRSERGLVMPPLQEAMERFFRDGNPAWRGEALAIAAE